MRTLIVCQFLFFTPIVNIYSQNSTVPPIIHSQTTLSRLTKAGGFNGSEVMRGIPLPPPDVIGSPYLDDEWHIGTVMLYQGDALIERHPLRYDLEKDLLEIYDGKTVKILESVKIKSFLWVKDSSQEPQYFVNARDFNLNGSALLGFFEVLVDGQMPLLKKTELIVQKANYVKEFDTGSRNDKLVKNEYLYYADQKMIARVPKRKLSMIFKTSVTEIEQLIKDQNLNVKDVKDLVTIFKKYNSLSAQ